MKIKILLPVFLFTIAGFGQINYAKIEHIINSKIDSYKDDSEEFRFLQIVKKNFDKEGKVNQSNFKTNVGIAFVLSNESKNPEIYPAKFTQKNELLNISSLKADKEASDDYVQKYLHKIESLGSTKIFRAMMQTEGKAVGKYLENKTETVVNEPLSLSFIRGNEDWMYIISIDQNYAEISNPRIIVYAFKISLSGEDIFNAGNSVENIEDRRLQLIEKSKSGSNKFPLYHDFRTDEIRDGLEKIVKVEPFKSDRSLIEILKKIDEPITRYNIKDYVEEFKLLLSANISKDALEKNFQSFEEEEAFNIKHLASHALADYYFGAKQYELAIDYYKKSIFEFPYEESSGTGVVKDAERIIYDIAKANYYAGKKEEAYGFLIGLMIDSQRNYDLANKTINEFFEAEKENKKIVKKDLDKALKTIKKGKGYTQTFIFRNKETFFFPMMPSSQKEYEESFKESEFYKSL